MAKPRKLSDLIMDLDDPIDTLSSRLLDLLYEDDEIRAACQLLIYDQMDIPPNTVFGAEEADGYEHYISETDPRYELYYELLANLHHVVMAAAMLRDGLRYQRSFREARDEREGRATQ